jgi:plasmid replication initiation protein
MGENPRQNGRKSPSKWALNGRKSPFFFRINIYFFPNYEQNIIKTALKDSRGILQGLTTSDRRRVIMGKEELSTPGSLVKKSNSIIRTRLTVKNVEASRILAHLIACIRTDDTSLAETYTAQAKDILPYSGGGDYKHLKGTCKELVAAFAETEEPDPDGPHPIFTAQPFFTRIRYRNGLISATFNPFMRPYLLELKGCFTTYNLTEYLSLPSLYSQRIFEITKSLANSKDGEAIVSMADLHRFLDTPKSFQANFKDFRRFVLEKAHKDITEKTTFRFEWEPVKVGRSVEKIRFIFNGGKKALAQKEQEKAKEEKRRRLTNQRFIRAVECAKAKDGDCRVMDNVRIVCKLCREKEICSSIRRK